MASTPERRLRILVLWNASAPDLLRDVFLANSDYDFEFVDGGGALKDPPASVPWNRLWNLRRRLARGEFDMVLSSTVSDTPSPRRRSLWSTWLLAGKLHGKIPFAVTDFLETPHVLPNDYPLLKACTLYFKTNLYFWPRRSLMPLETVMGNRRVTSFTTKLRPLTEGYSPKKIPENVRPMSERDIDICLISPEGADDPIRQNIYERCQKLKDRYKIHHADGVVPHDQYPELLQRSKLVVCPEGFGCETERLHEAAAAGAVALVNWPYAQSYHPYHPGVHAIYFSMIGDDFERVITEALSSSEKLQKIADNARAFVLQYKDSPGIGHYVIVETLRQHALDRADE